MTKTKNVREEFLFLNGLRYTGAVNMFGAAPYLEMEFELTNREARRIVAEWMAWVDSSRVLGESLGV